MRWQVWNASHCLSSVCAEMSALYTSLCRLGRGLVGRGRGSFSPLSSGSFWSVWGKGDVACVGDLYAGERLERLLGASSMRGSFPLSLSPLILSADPKR